MKRLDTIVARLLAGVTQRMADENASVADTGSQGLAVPSPVPANVTNEMACGQTTRTGYPIPRAAIPCCDLKSPSASLCTEGKNLRSGIRIKMAGPKPAPVTPREGRNMRRGKGDGGHVKASPSGYK